MANIVTSPDIDLSFMTFLHWRECDTNVCPVAGREAASDGRRCSFICIRKKRMLCQKTFRVIIPKSNLVSLWILEVYVNNNTTIYRQFRVVISLFPVFIDVCANSFGDWERWNTYQDGWREEKAYIAAVSLQCTRGLIVAEFGEHQAPGATLWQLGADGSKPPFALLAALCIHMLWNGKAMWDAQLAVWTGSDGVLCPRLAV